MGLRCRKGGGARRSHSRLLTREMDMQRGRMGGCWPWGCRARNEDVSPWSDSWIIEIVLGKRSKGESFERHLTCGGGHPQRLARYNSFALQKKPMQALELWSCSGLQNGLVVICIRWRNTVPSISAASSSCHKPISIKMLLIYCIWPSPLGNIQGCPVRAGSRVDQGATSICTR
jgi:hypothetical protein